MLGELGANNARVGATLGFNLHDNQYFKVSGEYLWQRINYSFVTGDEKEWVSQGALGAAYEFFYGGSIYQPMFGINGYVSSAGNKTLSDVPVLFTDSSGNITEFINTRRIAGSKAFGLGPGFSVMPWRNGKIGAILNYDKVHYDTIFSKLATMLSDLVKPSPLIKLSQIRLP